MFRTLFAIVTLICLAPALYAHEFWIAPEKYQVESGDDINAHFRVGQGFKGSNYSFLSYRSTQILWGQHGELHDLDAIDGNRPAIVLSSEKDGLLVLAHETTDSVVKYDEWEDFTTFAAHKGAHWAIAYHTRAGLPHTGFEETYRRYAKSLVAVGDGRGLDFTVGFDFEFIALDNPYNGIDILPVELLLYGTPQSNAQIEVFAKSANGDVTIKIYTTNADGVVMIPLAPNTEYMVDSVHLEPLTPVTDKDPVWHSKWANITFHTP